MASVFDACLLICSEVSGDQRIFIGGPLMIQQVQKFPRSDAAFPSTCQIQSRMSHQSEIPPNGAPSNAMSGVKRLRAREADDPRSLHHCHQCSNERGKLFTSGFKQNPRCKWQKVQTFLDRLSCRSTYLTMECPFFEIWKNYETFIY